MRNHSLFQDVLATCRRDGRKYNPLATVYYLLYPHYHLPSPPAIKPLTPFFFIFPFYSHFSSLYNFTLLPSFFPFLSLLCPFFFSVSIPSSSSVYIFFLLSYRLSFPSSPFYLPFPFTYHHFLSSKLSFFFLLYLFLILTNSYLSLSSLLPLASPPFPFRPTSPIPFIFSPLSFPFPSSLLTLGT